MALAVVSMVLFGGAVALGWAKFPEVSPEPSEPKAQLLTVTVTKQCGITFKTKAQTITQVTEGTYRVRLVDPGSKKRVSLIGGDVRIVSTAPAVGTTESDVALKAGTYTAACTPSTPRKTKVLTVVT